MKQKRSRLHREIQPMPTFVKQALKINRLLDAYNQRPPYQKNDYLGWINCAKKEETKEKRLLQMLEELKIGNKYMKMDWKTSNHK